MQSPSLSKKANSFNNILKGSQFQHIFKKAQLHQTIDELLQSLLEEDLKKHCKVAVLEGNNLILHIDRAAFATRIKFCTPSLIQALKIYPPLQGLRKITCKVRPTW